jgi:hypothetical protein
MVMLIEATVWTTPPSPGKNVVLSSETVMTRQREIDHVLQREIRSSG